MVANGQSHLPFIWAEPRTADQSQDLLAGIGWSYTRRTALEQCPRRYYYEYYGAKAPGVPGDWDKSHVVFLRSLQTRHERVGSIAHLVIGTYLRKAQSGEIWPADRLGRWSREIFRKDCAYSRSDPEGTSRPRGRFPPVLLQEFYYRHPDASALCVEAEERLVNAILVFASSPRFAEFRRMGATLGSLVEHRFTVEGLPCRVGGKVDLAAPIAGRVSVVDWKLGDSDNGGDDSLQLAAYGLWATRRFNCQPEATRVCKVHLTTEKISNFSTTNQVLARCRARIVQDAERMAAVDDYGQRGVAEAFTPCAQPGVCALCPFQGICPEGRAALHA